jgi:hypothetical protein
VGTEFDNFYSKVSTKLALFSATSPSHPTASATPPTSSTVSSPYIRPSAPAPAFTPPITFSPSLAPPSLSVTAPPRSQTITPEASSNPPTFTSSAAAAVAPQRVSPSTHSRHATSSTSASTPTPTLTTSFVPSSVTAESPLQFRSSFSELTPFYATLAKNATLTASTLDRPTSTSPSTSSQANFSSRSGSHLSTHINAPFSLTKEPPVNTPYSLSKEAPTVSIPFLCLIPQFFFSILTPEPLFHLLFHSR